MLGGPHCTTFGFASHHPRVLFTLAFAAYLAGEHKYNLAFMIGQTECRTLFVPSDDRELYGFGHRPSQRVLLRGIL